MKKILIVLVVIMGYNSTFGQQIKDLKYYHTDRGIFNPSSLSVTRVYYKDLNNYFTPFLGQWKYINGNQTFVVTLWKETKYPFGDITEPLFYKDEIYGHYQMFQDYGLPTQSLLYTSQATLTGVVPPIMPTILVAGAIQPNFLTGIINDVYATPLNPKYPMGTSGYLSMTINSGTFPLTAQWRVAPNLGIKKTGQPRNFVIPTNVILTKI